MTDRPAAVSTPPQASAGDSCPLCGAPLRSEQEWCLRCGAAARTRLAAAPNSKAPIAALAVVIALSLGVLAAALVKLAGDSGSAAPATTIVTAASAATPAPASPLPGATAPGTAAGGTTSPGTAAPGGTPPGATSSTAGKPTATTPANSFSAPGSNGAKPQRGGTK